MRQGRTRGYSAGASLQLSERHHGSRTLRLFFARINVGNSRNAPTRTSWTCDVRLYRGIIHSSDGGKEIDALLMRARRRESTSRELPKWLRRVLRHGLQTRFAERHCAQLFALPVAFDMRFAFRRFG